MPGMTPFPAQGAYPVTPNDSVALARGIRGLYIGTTGDLRLRTLEGDDVTFANVPVGVFQIACAQVYATGTTAGNIVGLV